MKAFPVLSSILATEPIAAFVKEQYGLSGAVTASILKTGISHTYLIRAADKKYVFRIYSLNWRSETEIMEELGLLNLLRENQVPVSYPLKDIHAAYIQRLQAPEGIRLAVLFSFAEGEKRLNFSAELHHKAGEIMGKLHSLTRDVQVKRITYNNDSLLIDSFEQLKQRLSTGTEEMQFMQLLQSYLMDTFNHANKNELRNGVVHLDIWFDNFVIKNDSDITLFDFDFCGNGWLVLDIAYYILQIYSTEKDEKEFNLKKESFLRGYESITPVSDEEKRLVPAAAASIYFFYLGIQCRRFDDWSNNFLNEIYLKRFINLLVKKWANFNQLQAD